jgi:methionine biosynthesis protein MetW
MAPETRLDHKIIRGMIEPGSRVLDLGCGSGELMYILARDRNARVQGIELDDAAVQKCIKKGLSVFHSDIESGLEDYPDRSFDYAVLNQSMQEVRKVDFIVEESLRVAPRIIVGFPNFAHIRARWMLFFRGRSPVMPPFPHLWYDTPNVRFLSISDFRGFCTDKHLQILDVHYLGRRRAVRLWPNLLAHNAVFMVARQKPAGPGGIGSQATAAAVSSRT